MELGIPELKAGILLLWALWLSLVTILNITDGLKAVGVLPPTWVFASSNYVFIVETTKIYRTPPWVNAFLFVGVIVWEVLASALLWRAFFMGGELNAVNTAFVVSLALWGAFIVIDEFFLTFIVEGEGGYSVAATHRGLFSAFLVSLLALHLL